MYRGAPNHNPVASGYRICRRPAGERTSYKELTGTRRGFERWRLFVTQRVGEERATRQLKDSNSRKNCSTGAKVEGAEQISRKPQTGTGGRQRRP